MMRYLSVCSGIEAATAAWHELGWTPVAFSEIEPFPSAVLAHHYPHVPNWGDLTRYADWPDTALDVLVGGTPCQSFSVAGFRAGLADPRGNLALTFLAVVDRYRPTWVVWENVPGVLSSNRGRDFGAFVGGLAELGYGWAYRVLDAQYFGVAQRRRRVFVVGCLGNWQRAASVLFDAHSLSGHPPPSREAREDFANALTERPDRGGTNSEGQRLIPARHTAPTLSSRRSAGGGLGTDADCDGAVIAVPEISACLETTANDYSRADGFTMIATAFDTTQITSPQNYSVPKPRQPCHPLASSAHPPSVAVPHAVRRLTPRECERLQGFPDDYTAIPYRKRPADQCPDGPRYKALGNSMAVPVMRWIGERLAYTHAVSSLVIPHGLAVQP